MKCTRPSLYIAKTPPYRQHFFGKRLPGSAMVWGGEDPAWLQRDRNERNLLSRSPKGSRSSLRRSSRPARNNSTRYWIPTDPAMIRLIALFTCDQRLTVSEFLANRRAALASFNCRISSSRMCLKIHSMISLGRSSRLTIMAEENQTAHVELGVQRAGSDEPWVFRPLADARAATCARELRAQKGCHLLVFMPPSRLF